MSKTERSQFDATLVIRVSDAGAARVRGLTAIAAYTLVSDVATELRENHETSSFPLASAPRSAGRKFSAPATGLSSTTGTACTGASEPRLKLCSRMSPSG